MSASPGLLVSVLDDLEHLRDTWDADMTEKRLRYDVAIIRRLLIDHGAGTLRTAWKQTGHKGDPRVLAPDLGRLLGDFDRRQIVFAQSGGVEWRGLQVAGGSFVEGDQAPGEPDVEVEREMPLSRFLDAPCLVYSGVSIKRRELIQYVANKAGGVHYDPVRTDEDVVFKALDRLPDGMAVVVDGHQWPLSMKYVELLAIGKLLVDAEPIREWLTQNGR